VWINGHHLGKRPSGYTSFFYELTPYLKQGGENVISVRVDHSLYADSRWYAGSGIYRHVWLSVTDKVRVAQWGSYVTTPSATTETAKVRIENAVLNESGSTLNLELLSVIIEKDGKEAGRNSVVQSLPPGETTTLQEITVKKPQLWGVESPNLYSVKTTLRVDGKVVDEVSTVFGIRTFSFD
jgi:beta-galactosidase